MQLSPLKLGDREIPLSLPCASDRVALFKSFSANQEKEAVVTRLSMAAIGLAWMAAGKVVPPWPGGLAESGYDLVRFGEVVDAALSEEEDLISIFAAAESVVSACMVSMIPRQDRVEDAGDFLGHRPEVGFAPA